MAFTQTTFLGASVVNFSTSIGWNGESSSQLQVTLVEDPVNGDSFTKPQTGSPVTFTFGDFRFRGLIRAWVKNKSAQGNPLYDVRLEDAREILQGTQVIVNAYNGNVFGLKNLINVFGFYESVAFGFSGSNDGGMPWVDTRPFIPTIKKGLEAIINESTGSFGGPLKTRGRTYKLDLSEMPSTPNFYRLGGNSNISLLEIISSVCFDAGFDFFFEISEPISGANGGVIKIRTVSRVAQPSLQAVTTFIDAQVAAEKAASASTGREFRNEVSSSFIVGGPRTFLRELAGQQYWGTTFDGNVISGSTPILQVPNSVAEILGTTFYPTNVFEMKCALANQDTWQQYMTTFNTPLADFLKLYQPYLISELITGIRGWSASRNPDPNKVKALTDGGTDHLSRQRAVYDFVRNAASEFYGKKFVVPLTFLAIKIESDTLQFITSEELTSAAFEGSAPIGGKEALLFKSDDGRFETFCVYNDISDADLSNIKLGDDAIIQNGRLFIRCSVESEIILFSGDSSPFVVINVNTAIFKKRTHINYGSVVDMQTLLQGIDALLLKKNTDIAGVPGSLEVWPDAIFPSSFFIPFQSNVSTYGPWGSQRHSDGGKVSFQVDSSMVPWNFAGINALNQVGNALALNATTGMQEAETGNVELAEQPRISLGDALVAGGPNVTSIDVKFGSDGIKTNYTMRTYTPRFGLFAKDFVDRIRRLNTAQQNGNNALRKALKIQISKQKLSADAERGRMFNTLLGLKPKTPHQFIMARTFESESSGLVTSIASYSHDDLPPSSRAGELEYGTNIAYVGMEGLFRPFSTDVDFEGNMSKYESPDTDFEVDSLTLFDIDPFQTGHDVVIAAGGSGDNSFGWLTSGSSDIRPVSLRGPLVITGWGYGFPATSGDAETPDNLIGSDFLTMSQDWKTGPVDLLWDDQRKVWTSHTAMLGTLLEELSGNGSANMAVSTGSGSTSYVIKVYNWFSTDVSNGSKVMAQFFPHSLKWYVVSADCV